MPVKNRYTDMIPTTVYLTSKQKNLMKIQEQKYGTPMAVIVRKALDKYLDIKG